MATPPPLRVFSSYSHRDQAFRRTMENHLSLLKRKGVIQGWSDRDITAGEEWRTEIDQNLEAADMVFLLISDEFIASDYAWDMEMTRALERHDAGETRVIPILLKPVDQEDAPFARLQALPANGRPITKWSNRHEGWLDVAKGIRRVAEELNERHQSSPLATTGVEVQPHPTPSHLAMSGAGRRFVPTLAPLRVFYSYANLDDTFREALEKQLTVLKLQGAILQWSSRDITAGQDWKSAVDRNLEAADIIILLVSADFLASEYAWDMEMTRALERHDAGEARVIPILLTPVDHEDAPFARLQALPRDGQPNDDWSNQEEAWHGVAQAIRTVTEEMAKQQTYPVPPSLPPAEFIGRANELAEIMRQLRTNVRMLTINGLFGIGKTRLAHQVALELRSKFRDGVCAVFLSRLDDPSLVASEIRAALDATETAGQPLESSLKSFLVEKQLLLILDRFDSARSSESLVLINELLEECPGLSILVTSREPINIQYAYQAQLTLSPLRTRAEKGGIDSREDTASDAARLFLAFAAGMGHAIDADRELEIVENICTQVGGHPQTINLVAGWLTSSSLQEIETGLVEFLRDDAERDDPLWRAWDESFQRLDAREQSVLSQLSVFRGHFTREAARNVVQADDNASPGLRREFRILADRGFLERSTRAGNQSTDRYWVFETIRQLAEKKLNGDDAQAVRHSHATHYLALAERAESEIEGEHQVEWLEDIEADYSNLRAVLKWCVKTAGRAEMALRLAGALGPYWYHRGDFTEGRDWLKNLLATQEEVSPVVRAKALDLAGILAAYQGEYAEATASLDEARRLFQDLDGTDVTVVEMLTSLHFMGKDEGIARCLKDLAWVRQVQEDYPAARRLCVQSLELYRDIGDTWGVAQSAGDLGLTLVRLGETQEAIQLLRESLDLRTWFVKQPSGLSTSRLYLGIALNQQGDKDGAIRELLASLEIADSIGFRHGIALTAYYLGLLTFATGSFGEAASYLLRSLRLRDQMGDRAGVADCLKGLAAVASRTGRADLAYQLRARSDLDRPQITGPGRSATHVRTLIEIEVDDDAIRHGTDPEPGGYLATEKGHVPTTSELTEAAIVLATVGP